MMSGGTTSGRVESSWPNLTNVGPSSSSISRRWRPRAVPSIRWIAGRAAVDRRSRSRAEPRPARSRSGGRGCAASGRAATRLVLQPAQSERLGALVDARDRRPPGAARRLRRRPCRRPCGRAAPTPSGEVGDTVPAPPTRADLDGHRLAAVVVDVDDRADADLVRRSRPRRSRRCRAAPAACGCAPRAGPARSSPRGTRSSRRGRRTRAPS